MWTIKQIFDGDYGCEELSPGEKPKVSVTIINEQGEERYISVEDDILLSEGLDIGSGFPEKLL